MKRVDLAHEKNFVSVNTETNTNKRLSNLGQLFTGFLLRDKDNIIPVFVRLLFAVEAALAQVAISLQSGFSGRTVVSPKGFMRR